MGAYELVDTAFAGFYNPNWAELAQLLVAIDTGSSNPAMSAAKDEEVKVSTPVFCQDFHLPVADYTKSKSHLNRRGGRLSARAASAVFIAIARAAGLEDPTTAHVGRHTFVTQLIRGGEDLVTVAELAGHARLDTLRIYSQPTDDDKQAALRHLTVDR
ncbi:site-specific integrase [Streptosporangium sp. NBC_01639]|uniref:tyrosine-type recombinase/integrase n=1 Tax=Streptosporangium sp. NBC_01639 TaxID=2975948 RepID=UPI00386D63A3|nr:site-specific integrase [Streptosporangium sp. NBC_01639]